MSATATPAAPTAPAVVAPRAGTVAVLLAGRENDGAAVAAAVSVAAASGSRLSIFTLPRRMPLGIHAVTFGYTPPFSSLSLRAEALLDAAASARRAVDLVPAGMPAEHVVVSGCPIEAVEQLVARGAVAHIVVDRKLPIRRRRLRRASGRWARAGTPLTVV